MEQSKSRTPWIVCGVIALVIVCGGAVALLGGFGLLAFIGGQSTTSLAIQLAAPTDVSTGDTFNLEVTVINEGSADATLDKITLPDGLLENAQVVRVNPRADGENGASFDFSLPISAGESQVVTFTLKAQSAAQVSGQIETAAGDTTQTIALDLQIAEAQAVEVEPTKDTGENQGNVPPAANGEIAGVPYKAVVQILAMVDMDGELSPGWSGSGSIISPDGLVLTNAHVVLSDRYYEVQALVVALTTQPDALPEPMYVAQVMQVDQAMDIAVLRIETDLDGNPVDRANLNLPTVPMGDDGALQLGDSLTILGYPSIGGSTITLTRGEVSGFTAEEGYGNRAFIKTSATISGGNSGGLAANAQGQIIGIPTQLGYGGDDQYVDCRVLADTNRDGVVDESDNCVPTGGFINALRPLALARPMIDAAARGEVNIVEGVQGVEGSIPEEEGASVVLEDDFSNPDSGWDDSAWEDGSVHYVDGEYQVTVVPVNWLLWSYLGDEYADAIINVDTRITSSTGVGDYGIICRFVDDSNYYAFEVSEDGYFSIWKQFEGEMVTLYDWEYSDSIPMDSGFNIGAACVGNRLLMAVNDVLLADITDDSFTTGKVGIIAGTLDVGNMQVTFDNFIVQQP